MTAFVRTGTLKEEKKIFFFAGFEK